MEKIYCPVCDEEFANEQRKKQKIKTQFELVKECKGCLELVHHLHSLQS